MLGTDTTLFRMIMLMGLVGASLLYGPFIIAIFCRIVYLLLQKPPETMSAKTAAMQRRLTIVVLLQVMSKLFFGR